MNDPPGAITTSSTDRTAASCSKLRPSPASAPGSIAEVLRRADEFRAPRERLLRRLATVEQAGAQLDAALAGNPSDPRALALASIAALVQNATDRATGLAERAVGHQVAHRGSRRDRRVEEAGAVEVRFTLRPRFGYGQQRPWIRTRDGILELVAGPDGLHLEAEPATGCRELLRDDGQRELRCRGQDEGCHREIQGAEVRPHERQQRPRLEGVDDRRRRHSGGIRRPATPPRCRLNPAATKKEASARLRKVSMLVLGQGGDR